MQSGQFGIRVRGLEKSFRIPSHRVHTLKERALHPLRRTSHYQLDALRGIDFDVLQGEFFGIVGRNGSGKSTLLKCLAGIYQPDAGTMHVAGRLSPFIELGVGFNPDLPARDNVMINAVMMGLSPRDARGRFDEIIAFAELERFVDQKLKNYSSGMQVRLAFSVMVHTDPDVLLIDEVLAVGDAAFQQKCIDVFYRLRGEGKTIVLVTHAMGMVEQFCHRAMMISGGHIIKIGDPAEVARSYLSENFRSVDTDTREHTAAEEVRIVDAWVSDAQGQRVDSVQFGDGMRLHVVLEALGPIREPGIALWVTNEDRVRVFSAGAREDGGSLSDLEAGERVEFSVETENRLSSGRYHVGCTLVRGSAGLEVLLYTDRAADFVSYGMELHGLVGVDYVTNLERGPSKDPVR
ncbi:MAG TPA: ABC transporter ATP-binding protein [Solirubrobacteraceae bacterium]|jgi:ABC-type polysaccharide/polyol phosphate transport system ATPase subunit